MDARGRTPTTAKLFSVTHRKRTLVLTTKLAPVRWRRHLALLGIDVVVVNKMEGRVDLQAALRVLGEIDVTSVLVEGGGELLGSLFDARMVDEVALFYAPVVIGGHDAVMVVAGEGAATVTRAVRIRDCHWRQIGKDEMLVEARVGR